MIRKIISAILSGVLLFTSTSFPVYAQENTKENVSVSDIELMLSKQQEEFNKKAYIYGIAGATGATIIGGGIYAYYTQKQLGILRKRNLVLSYKVSKAEALLNSIAKENSVLNRKMAKNVNLVKENKAYIDELVKYVEDIANALNQHGEAINAIAQQTASEVAESAKPRRPVGFKYIKENRQLAQKTKENIAKGMKNLKNIGKKGGIIGVVIAGAVTAAYIYSRDYSADMPISDKRIVFERALKSAYDNDEGFFVLDVLAASTEDLRLTASVLDENPDFYSLFVKQQREAESAALNAKSEKNMIEQVKNEEFDWGNIPSFMSNEYSTLKTYLN